MGINDHFSMSRVSVLVVCFFAALGLCEEAGFRKPRFFFVTTSSITETLRTNSLCYVTANAGFSGECKRRKKRSLFRTGRLPWYDAVQPTKATRGDEEEYSEDESSSYEADGREGRFLLYWITTTSRSTTTIYSSTYSVHSVECTPSRAMCFASVHVNHH